MKSGIYCIENKVNGKKYIGFAVDIDRRWNMHRYSLRGNYHDNWYLQNAWNKHGEENFEFKIIEIYKRSEKILKSREIYYIDFYKSFRDDGGGYNLTRGGDGNLGRIFTEEEKKASSKLHMGQYVSEEQKKRISKSLLGKPKPKGFGKSKQGIRVNKDSLTSIYVGISYISSRHMWKFSIQKDDIVIQGRRKTEILAAQAYNKAAIKLYGKNAKLNIIKE